MLFSVSEVVNNSLYVQKNVEIEVAKTMSASTSMFINSQGEPLQRFSSQDTHKEFLCDFIAASQESSKCPFFPHRRETKIPLSTD